MTRTSSLPFLALSCIVLGCFLVSAGCTLFQSSNQKTVNSSVVLQVPATTEAGAQAPPSGGAATAQCSSGMTSCRGNCVNTQADHDNCGGCSNICNAGQVCQNSQCTSTGGSLQCSTGQTLCGGSCVNTQTAFYNCGACGNSCSSGQICSSGSCSGATASAGGSNTVFCNLGQTACNGICVNTQSDTSNCGSCGKKCSSGQVCSSGSCTAVSTGGSGTTFCNVGQTSCSGTCADLKSDKSNCGSCGKKCSSGQVCSSGTCTAVSAGGSNTGFCNLGQTSCSGSCVNTQTDTGNCGACAKKCLSGEACSQGKCLSWTGSWTGFGGATTLVLTQTGTSVTGGQQASSGNFVLSGTTSGTPPKLTCTWSDGSAWGGPCEFSMTADGKQFSGWTATITDTQNKKYYSGTRS